MAARESLEVDAGTLTTQRILGRVATYIALLFFSVLFLFPLVWMITTSLKSIGEINTSQPVWFPSPPQWENYKIVTAKLNFWRYTLNTVMLCVLTVTGTVLSCSLAAYGFARIKWPGRDKLFIITLGTMMIPFPVLMVPLYALFKEFGWVGTFKPLWVPSFFASAYNIFLLRQFFMTIPQDLTDAAVVDGCSEFRIFWQMIIPLARSALMVVGLFCFMAVWNDFLGPLIYLSNENDFTLALGLQAFQSQHGGTDTNLLMAAGSVMVLPVIVLFFFTQKSFIEGISLTGLKL